MAKTIGSFDLASLKNLRDDVTQYFWFESDSSSAWGSGAHVTLYPESQFTDSTNPNYMKGQNIIMNTDGFSIRNGALPMMVLDNDSLDFNAVDTMAGTYKTTATFSSIGARIGQSGESRLEMDYRSMKLVDKNDDSYFYVSDLIDSDGNTTTTYESDGVQTVFELICQIYNPSDVISVKINDSEVTSGWSVNVQSYPAEVIFTSPPTLGDVIEITYIPGDIDLKAYTLGFRRRNNPVGRYSYALGANVIASGMHSFGQGAGVTASGDYAHATGDGVVASGFRSHAQNNGTIAARSSQTALGTFNVEDPLSSTTTHPNGVVSYGQYAVIVGNGKSKTNRSNALTVDWSGNVTINNHDSEIGHVYSDSKSVAISNTTIDHNTDGASLSLSAGVYIVVGQWHFNTRTTTGTTNSAIRLYRSGSSDNIAQTRVMAGDSNWNSLQCTAIVTLTSTETIKVCGATSRPYTTAQGTYINAIRIK